MNKEELKELNKLKPKLILCCRDKIDGVDDFVENILDEYWNKQKPQLIKFIDDIIENNKTK